MSAGVFVNGASGERVEITHCFYKDGQTNIQDIAIKRENGGWYGGHSGECEQMIKERTGAVLMLWDDAEERLDFAIREKYVSPPERIDEKAWMFALEVLPPQRWYRSELFECFHCMERITHDLVDWYVRIGERRWHLVESYRKKHDELMKIVTKGN